MKKKLLIFFSILFLTSVSSYSFESYLGIGAGVSFDGDCDSLFLDITCRDFYIIPYNIRFDLLFEDENFIGLGLGLEGGIGIDSIDVFAGIEDAIIWDREYSEIVHVLKINAAVQFYINKLVCIRPNVMYVFRFNHDEMVLSDKSKILLALSAGIRI